MKHYIFLIIAAFFLLTACSPAPVPIESDDDKPWGTGPEITDIIPDDPDPDEINPDPDPVDPDDFVPDPYPDDPDPDENTSGLVLNDIESADIIWIPVGTLVHRALVEMPVGDRSVIMVKLLNMDGSLIEWGIYKGTTGDARKFFRFKKEGEKYPSPAILYTKDYSDKYKAYLIPDTGKKYEH